MSKYTYIDNQSDTDEDDEPVRYTMGDDHDCPKIPNISYCEILTFICVSLLNKIKRLTFGASFKKGN